MKSLVKYLRSMKILILSNSRCGSTNLMKSISSAYNIPYVFEPFIIGGQYDLSKPLVLKSLINQNSLEFYREFIPMFDKVIFLTRRNTIEMVESLVDMKKRFKDVGYDVNAGVHSVPYSFDYDGDITEDEMYFKVVNRKNELIKLANEFNHHIDYYEDVFIENKSLVDTDIKLDLNFLDERLKLRKK